MPKAKHVMTDRQRYVLDLYFGAANLNKTKALRLAGYANPAKQHEFFSRVAVKREMERRQKAFKKKYEVTYERVEEEIAKLAFFNPLSILSFDPETGLYEVDMSQADAADMAAIGEIKVKKTRVQDGEDEDGKPVWVETTTVFVKPWNKLKALDDLMRHAGLSKQKDTTGLADLANRINAARDQVGGGDGS